MRHCAFCSTELPERAQFCGYCGRLTIKSGEWSTEHAGPSLTYKIQGNTAPMVPGPPRSSTPRPQIAGEQFQGGCMQFPHQSFPHHTRFKDQNEQARKHTVSSVDGIVAMRWVILVVTAVVMLTTAGVGAAFAVSPSLSFEGGLSGNSIVVPGQRLSLYGSGFLPGGHVTLQRDDNQLLPMAAQHTAGTTENASLSARTHMATLSALSFLASAIVSSTGTFDVSLLVGKDWGQGNHTIHATEDIFSRSATMIVTVGDAPPVLSVSPTSLDFGSLQKGTKASLTLAIGNSGGKPLAWRVESAETKWLTLQSTSGDVLPGGASASLAVACDTTSLALGTYSTTIHVHTAGGNADINVALSVIAQRRAQISVSPGTLDFQTMHTGQQATRVVTISDTGTLKLNWQATSNESWVSPGTASGSVQPTGVPQKMNVLVDTTVLQPGSYSAMVTISSNGGTVQVTIFLVVPALPTPTPTPTLVPQGSICNLPPALDFGTISQGQTATRLLKMSNCGGASFTWRLEPGDKWVTVDNSGGGTLDPNATVTLNVAMDATSLTGPASYRSTVTFFTSVGNQTVNVTVKVSAPTTTSAPIL